LDWMTVARVARSLARVRRRRFAQGLGLESEHAPGRRGRRLLLCLREHLPTRRTECPPKRALRDVDCWCARRMRQSAAGRHTAPFRSKQRRCGGRQECRARGRAQPVTAPLCRVFIVPSDCAPRCCLPRDAAVPCSGHPRRGFQAASTSESPGVCNSLVRPGGPLVVARLDSQASPGRRVSLLVRKGVSATGLAGRAARGRSEVREVQAIARGFLCGRWLPKCAVVR
jgi:hypothetical protein